MTRSSGAFHGSSEWTHSLPIGGLPKLPAHASTFLKDNTITVRDPQRVLAHHQWKRTDEFRRLVAQYISQLRHGCQEPSCKTTTCHTFRKRVSKGPCRRPTQSSAISIAFYLASQDEPTSALCPHLPKSTQNGTADANGRIGGRAKRGGSTPRSELGPPSAHFLKGNPADNQAEVGIASYASVHGELEAVDEAGADFGQSVSHAGCSRAHSINSGTTSDDKIDAKSLTQKLFNTSTVRAFVSSPLEVIREAYATLVSRKELGNSENNDKVHGGSTSSKHAEASLPSTPLAPQLDGYVGGPPSSTALKLSVLPSPGKKSARDGSLDMLSCPESLLQDPRDKPHLPILVTDPCSKSNLKLNASPPAHRQDSRIAPKPLDSLKDAPNASLSNGDSVLTSKGSNEESNDFDECANHGYEATCATDYGADQVETAHNTVSLAPSEELPFLAQTLSAFDCDLMEELKSLRPRRSSDPIQEVNQRVSEQQDREATSFINQSFFYVFSDPEALLHSFLAPATNDHLEALPVTCFDAARLDSSFRGWDFVSRSVLMDALWTNLENLFVVPSELMPPKSPHLKAHRTVSKSTVRPCKSNAQKPLNDAQAAHIIKICIHVLTAAVDKATPEIWSGLHKLRAQGTAYREVTVPLVSAMEIIDRFEEDSAKHLASRVVRAIGARRCFACASAIVAGREARGEASTELLLQHLTATYAQEQSRGGQSSKARLGSVSSEKKDIGWSTASAFLEWLRGTLLQSWDGSVQVKRWSVAGGAIEMMADLYSYRDQLGLAAEIFETPFLSWRLDPMEILSQWLEQPSNCNSLHLLTFAFLFPPSTLVQYFRAFNYSSMYKGSEKVWNGFSLRHSLRDMLDESRQIYLSSRLKPMQSQYLWLNIGRGTVLMDALNQLWRRERRELLRTLKVRIGRDMAEEGADLGGVSQEFFRLAFAEALHPDNGLFVIEEESRMTWFQSGSLEPLYKFELLGLLAGLAVYNGATIPLNFPIAMYRKLLGLPVNTLAHIKDGWPQRAKGLEAALSCEDVSDFALSYVFSYDAFGERVEIDMGKNRPGTESFKTKKGKEKMAFSGEESGSFNAKTGHTSMLAEPEGDQCFEPKSNLCNGHAGPENIFSQAEAITRHSFSSADRPTEPAPVTNDNRQAYVQEYISHLTNHTIAPQYTAFEAGFYTIIPRSALSIFSRSPAILQTLVEGLPSLDIAALKQVTRYFDASDAEQFYGYPDEDCTAMQWFWHIVEEWDEQKRRGLLEFVTSSDRVPGGGGYEGLVFGISRNGGDTERLPTSSTCFGRLLLPEYESEDKMRIKLETAIENSIGFGMA